MNIKWWTEWFNWATRKATGLAKSGDFLAFTVFLGELGKVFEALVGSGASLTAAINTKGNILKRGQVLLNWAFNHSDPLAEARDLMRAMETKWGSAPTPLAGPATSGTSHG